MRFRIIAAHAHTWPIRTACRVLGVSSPGYYAWRTRPDSARALTNQQILADIRRLHASHHGRHGSPRLQAALRAEGRHVSRGRVERLMRSAGIRAIAGRRFRPATTSSRHALPVAPNPLNRQFAVTRPNTVWLADITCLPRGEGWLYLAAVLDLATRKGVGGSMREHMRAELTGAALTMAIQRQQSPSGLLQHADRGSQYAADDYRRLLTAAGMRQSMRRRGNCLDNASMESFFHTLKVELAQQRRGPRGTMPDATCSPTSKAPTTGSLSTLPWLQDPRADGAQCRLIPVHQIRRRSLSRASEPKALAGRLQQASASMGGGGHFVLPAFKRGGYGTPFPGCTRGLARPSGWTPSLNSGIPAR